MGKSEEEEQMGCGGSEEAGEEVVILEIDLPYDKYEEGKGRLLYADIKDKTYEANVRAIFDYCDKDKDGHLNLDEANMYYFLLKKESGDIAQAKEFDPALVTGSISGASLTFENEEKFKDANKTLTGIEGLDKVSWANIWKEANDPMTIPTICFFPKQ